MIDPFVTGVLIGAGAFCGALAGYLGLAAFFKVKDWLESRRP